ILTSSTAHIYIDNLESGCEQTTDTSDYYFTVAAGATPTIPARRPYDRESWTTGSTHTITWSASALDSRGTVYVYAIINGAWYSVASAPTYYSSSRWTVPYLPTSTAQIWVGNWVNGAWETSETSDGYFTM